MDGKFYSGVLDSILYLDRLLRHLLVAALLLNTGWAQQQANFIDNQPIITDVSAMCTEDGITAQMMFDEGFSGKIYSNKYSETHECVYYNNYGEPMVLFTIPNYLCGTRLTRDSQNQVKHIENEVYVQFDKDTQNVEDRRYLFICDLTYLPPSDFSGTVQPQTIVVQTIEPTRIFVTQSGTGSSPPSIAMSITDGDGPFRPPVSRPLKLGDVVTLVVRSAEQDSSSRDYRMFVHSCFAADGTGGNKVELIDRSGCNVRPKVVGPMKRTRNSDGEVIYFTRLQAFKFPSSDDVYFSCSVDVCSSCNFAEICPIDGNRIRNRRSVSYQQINRPKWMNSSSEGQYRSDGEKLEINEIQLHDYVRILDEEELFSELAASSRRATSADNYCFSPLAVVGVVSAFGCLSVALIILTIFVIVMVNRRDKTSSHEHTVHHDMFPTQRDDLLMNYN